MIPVRLTGKISAAIRTKTDTINWEDVDAIAAAVGANQAETLYSKVGDILTAVGDAAPAGHSSIVDWINDLAAAGFDDTI